MSNFALSNPEPKIKHKTTGSGLPVQMFSRADRLFISKRLFELGYPKEADRFEQCRRRLVMLRCREEGREFAIRETCKSRICPECQKVVRRMYFRRWYDYFRRMPKQSGKQLMLLTLTLKSTGDVDDVKVRLSYKMVRLLLEKIYGTRANRKAGIKRRSMKQNGVGAVGVSEFGKNWNLHFHLIVYGPRVPQAKIAQVWYDLTKTSYVVDIRRVKTLKGGTWEVLKYLAKIPQMDGGVEYLQYLRVLRGVRRVHTYGAFYNAIPAPKRERSRLKCPVCGSRLLIDGHSYVWDCIPSYHWWHKRLNKNDPGGDDVPLETLELIKKELGWPSYRGNLLDALGDDFHAGFYLPFLQDLEPTG